MPHGKRPRDLSDISHLYISSRKKRPGPHRSSTALVLIASLEAGPWRAFFSAGLAAAFGAQGTGVTLLETGQGLPCAGYYFALEPAEYLSPVLDAGNVVAASPGRGIAIRYARDPSLLEGPLPEDHRIVLFAWDREGADLTESLDSVPALGGRKGYSRLPAFLLTLSGSGPAVEGAAREFRGIFPGGPALAIFPGGEKCPGAETVEYCPFPEAMLEGLGRRKPPVSGFLAGLAGEIPQRLAAARKESARDVIR